MPHDPNSHDPLDADPVEARIVAWVLGEASAFEAAELERLCEERPELLVFRRRMRSLHNLLTESEAAEPDESWKLPPEKRRKLEEIFGPEKPRVIEVNRDQRIQRSGRRAIWGIAACLVLTLVVAHLLRTSGIEFEIPSAESDAQKSTSANASLATSREDVEKATDEMQRAVRAQEDKVEERRKVLSTIVKSKENSRDDSRPDAIRRGLDVQDYDDAKQDYENDLALLQKMKLREVAHAVPNTKDVDPFAEKPMEIADAPAGGAVGDDKPQAWGGAAESGVRGNAAFKVPSMRYLENSEGIEPVDRGSTFQSMPALAADLTVVESEPAGKIAGIGIGSGFGSGLGKSSDPAGGSVAVLPASPRVYSNQPELEEGFATAPPPTESSRIGRAGGDSDAGSNTRSELGGLDQVPKAESASLAGEVGKKEKAARVPVSPAEHAEEIPASDNPYSTFSLHASDVSFKLAKAAIARGNRPDPADVKVEQFYNAMDYGDPAPRAGEPVAGVVEQSAHPFISGRNLVRVALRTASAGRAAAMPLRLTLLVDQSGSMIREDRRAAMDAAVKQLATLLTKDDRVTVVSFSRQPRLLAESLSGADGVRLAGLLSQAPDDGGTNLEEALKLAGQMAERQQIPGAGNRIVLLTDGAANLGDADPLRLAERVKELRQKGIALDIAGIGADGVNDHTLAELARHGNGRYHVVGKDDGAEFSKQLAGAFRPAAENVKVQLRFNPERVAGYKLIGFEKDRLKTEDFRNDKVDAAELAAEEAGVAIYQVEPLAEGSGEIGEVSVRFKDMATGEMVERTWTIPHDSSVPAFDKATPSMQLAGLAMLTGEKLRGGPLADAIDFKQLAASKAQVKRSFSNSTRVAELLTMIGALE